MRFVSFGLFLGSRYATYRRDTGTDESKCKIIVSAEAGPEEIFFPDALEDSARQTNEEVMAQEALSDAVSAPFRPNVSSYAAPEMGQDRQGEASRMFQRKEKSHPSEETTPAFKTLSIFTGEDERFAYVSDS
jgi:protein AFG1